MAAAARRLLSSSSGGTAARIDRLRRRLWRLEAATGLASECGAPLPLGIPAIDGALGGGLCRGALHEIAAAGEAATAAATGFAVINAVGNLGGFLGPYVVGATVRGHGDFSLGLYAMAGAAAISALLSYMLMRFRWDHTPARSAP